MSHFLSSGILVFLKIRKCCFLKKNSLFEQIQFLKEGMFSLKFCLLLQKYIVLNIENCVFLPAYIHCKYLIVGILKNEPLQLTQFLKAGVDGPKFFLVF